MTALDRYRRALAAIETLDPEVEQELARAFRNGDLDARRKLVEANLPFVMHIARRYIRWGLPLEDLVQQGNEGLLKAVAKFDPGRGTRLSTYAQFWIRAEIRDYVTRQHRSIRLGSTRTERLAISLLRRGDVSGAAELAEQSGMPLMAAERLMRLMSGPDVRLDEARGSASPPVCHLAAAEGNPEEALALRCDAERLRAAVDRLMDRLSGRERRIVQARLMSERPATLQDLGHELGITKERVRQLEVRVREKVRGQLAAIAC
jgi:RNA polymerase sigma-32 factor